VLLTGFPPGELLLVAVLFVWTGFVRTGIGFGGAALGLPVLLLVHDQPLDWLPIIGAHLLFFSALTLRTRLRHVDWDYLRRSGYWIVPAAIVGVLGLISLPNQWMVIFIYSVTLFYAVIWVMNWEILSHSDRFDRFLLLVGGYVAGTSLTGAPFIVAVYLRHVARAMLRNTLFVLWFVIVAIKMGTFAALDVDLRLLDALALLPVAAVGHVLGLKAHDWLMRDDRRFKRGIGGVLIAISLIGLWKALLAA
jgi:uncharacterized membrane protein YfcA